MIRNKSCEGARSFSPLELKLPSYDGFEEDMAGFKAAAAKFQQDAMTQTKDQASSAKVCPVVVSNCGACH